MSPRRFPSAALALILLVPALQADDPPPIRDHRPRAWVDSARIAWLRDNVDRGECGETFRRFLNAYNSNWITDPELLLVSSDSSRWTWNWSSTWARMQGMFVATLATITDDTTARTRAAFVADRFVLAVDTTRFDSLEYYERETRLRALSDVGSMLLDWCGARFDAPLRRRIAAALFALNARFMRGYVDTPAGRGYISSHAAYNAVLTMQNTIVLHGAEGLDATQRDSVDAWYRRLWSHWTEGFLPIYGYYRNDDGGWNWGAAYSFWGLPDQFQLFHVVRNATGLSLFDQLPWVRSTINQYLYMVDPDGWSIHLGDGMTSVTGDNVVYRHAAVFGDSVSTWMAQELAQPRRLTWTWPIYQKLMFKDFDAPTVARPQPPLDWWSDRVGLSVSRTSWDSTAAMVWFFCSPSKRASHEHRDNNTFAVHHRAPLIIDAGSYDLYGSSHFVNYYTRTVAHNTLCVYDSAGRYSYGSTRVSNDGGQVYSPQLASMADVIAPANQRGRWIRHGVLGDMSYSHADAALSYDPTTLDTFARRVLFDKPDRLIVLDRIHLNRIDSAQREARLLFHTVNRPQLTGTLIDASVPGHVERYTGADALIANRGGTAALRTLLPTQSTARLVGGAGFEYEVDGTNYPPSSVPDTVHAPTGRWRMEISAAAPTEHLTFLHTISIGDSATPARAGGTLVASTNARAVLWDSTLYLFARDGGIEVPELTADLDWPGGLLEIVACDLKPDLTYRVFAQFDPVSTAPSNNAGMLRTAVRLLPGAARIHIYQSECATPSTSAGLPSLSVASRGLAVNAELAGMSVGTFELVDLLGTVVTRAATRTGTATLVAPAPGLYLVRALAHGTTSVAKVLVVTD